MVLYVPTTKRPGSEGATAEGGSKRGRQKPTMSKRKKLPQGKKSKSKKRGFSQRKISVPPTAGLEPIRRQTASAHIRKATRCALRVKLKGFEEIRKEIREIYRSPEGTTDKIRKCFKKHKVVSIALQLRILGTIPSATRMRLYARELRLDGR